MTVRGGGIPRRPLALTPNGRMGPPLRSFAADAHDCIMVRVLGPTGYKVVARLNRAPKAGSPLIVIATALSVPSCSKPSRYGLARAKHAARLVRRPILTASARIDLSDARVGMKKRTLRSNQETDEGKRCAALANSLTKKAPYKGGLTTNWARGRKNVSGGSARGTRPACSRPPASPLWPLAARLLSSHPISLRN